MELTFTSIEEVRDFVAQLKGTRRGKGETEAETTEAPRAPAPIQPPGAAPQAAFGPTGAVGVAGFPAAPGPSFPAVAPEIGPLVARINAKIDGAVASGQPTDAVLGWFRQRCGAEAANATLDQIKSHFLAKLSVAHLEETAKLMGA